MAPKEVEAIAIALSVREHHPAHLVGPSIDVKVKSLVGSGMLQRLAQQHVAARDVQ